MEDVLRWTLFVVGTCAIIGVLVHGLWVSRRSSDREGADAADQQGGQRSQNNEPSFSLGDDVPQGTQTNSTDFDELGIGPVRVLRSASQDDTTPLPRAAHSDMLESPDDNEGPLSSAATGTPPAYSEENEQAVSVAQSTTDADISDGQIGDNNIASAVDTQVQPSPVAPGKVYASVVTQPKPEYASQTKAQPEQAPMGSASEAPSVTTNAGAGQYKSPESSDIPEPPPFLLKDRSGLSAQAPNVAMLNAGDKMKVGEKNEVSGATQTPTSGSPQGRAGQKAASPQRKRTEPKFTEDQLNIDFDEQQNQGSDAEANMRSTASDTKETQEQEVLVLNVKATQDRPIQGATLLPMLLTLGFKFGEQDIFHRHANANGKGPVLFSLANMFKPGVFDIDNLETFTTQGITLFMILPIEGDPHQVFNMMHNATRKIADEFDGQILDGRRSMLTKQGLQQYVERIREFERQRMIHR